MIGVHKPIAGAGICCLDYIILAPQVEWGDTAQVKDLFTQGGGLVATALVACARLGAECRFYSLLGEDDVASVILDELVSEKIDTSCVRLIKGGLSPFSFIHVDEKSGERTIFHRPGANLDLDTKTFDFAPIADCGALVVDDIYPSLALSAALFAREHGVPVVADLIPSPKNTALIEKTDILIAPRHYAVQAGFGDDLDAALDSIHDLGPTTALITLGADGWVYSDTLGRGRGDAFNVEVIDTTGAGDTFHGAFAYGVAQGWNTEKCATFASAVAAIKCTRAGGRTGLPTLEQALDFLKLHGIENRF